MQPRVTLWGAGLWLLPAALGWYLLGAASALADKRVALVIGNSAYQNVRPLDNPKNDARLIADTLRSLGFNLVGGGARLDVDKAAVDRAVQAFGAQLQGADVGLFYYAGHGVQVSGANYLVPIDANPVRQSDVDFQMLDANVVLRQMADSGAKLNIVILDACRNNPFGDRSLRGGTRGLAQMQAPEGTLISFATQPGNVAQDGTDGDSPYTKALAQAMRKPGLDIFRTFNEVGIAVASATGGAQQPWISLSPIKGDFYFSGAPTVVPPPLLSKDAEARIAALEAAQAAKPVPPSPDEVTWVLLKETTDEAALKRFTSQYPDSILRRDAEARIAALAAAQAAKPVPPSPDEVTWALLKETTDEAALRRFTTQYPNSVLRKDAEARIAALEASPKDWAATPTDPHELARSLQFELKRVGCFNGAVNGEFDDATKAAWRSFTKLTATTMSDDLSLATIKAVRGIDKRVCPLECPTGESPQGDRCVVTARPQNAKPQKTELEKTGPGPRSTTTAQPPHASDSHDTVQFKNAEGTWVTIPRAHNYAQCARTARSLGYGDSAIAQNCGSTGYIGPKRYWRQGRI